MAHHFEKVIADAEYSDDDDDFNPHGYSSHSDSSDDEPTVSEKIIAAAPVAKDSNSRCKRANDAHESLSNKKPKPNPKAAKPKASSGLDDLLSDLKGKKKSSVLEQSAKDWEKFKDDEDLEEELDEHMKSGSTHLEKEKFLAKSEEAMLKKK